MSLHPLLFIFSISLPFAAAKCYDPSPAFPLPLWPSGPAQLDGACIDFANKVESITQDPKYNSTSISIEITSQTNTICSYHHTARHHNASRPGTTNVNGSSQYRIASISKVFTTLGILYQHMAGNLSLDDPVSEYIAELQEPQSGHIPWKDITLRSLASQLSGLPREFSQGDLIASLDDPTKLGLPPASREGLPNCYQYNHYTPCNRSDLVDYVKKLEPLFAPNQQSTYSNLNYELLGLVLSNTTGLSYSEYMQSSIFGPLNLTSTSLTTPPDENAVLPVGQWYWDIDQGVHAPTGGIYSSSSDLSKFVRYIMTHYNGLVTGLNWIQPGSYATGMNTFYGMPWEIFRTDKILPESRRPVTFVTKAGGVPNYVSRISILPEYGLGITILIGGNEGLLGKVQETVANTLTRAAEKAIWKNINTTYSGTYTALNPSLNSSLSLSASPATGLILSSFISNGTDVFTTFLPQVPEAQQGPWRAQLVPTLLYKNETSQQGEIWRLLIVNDRTGEETIWDEFCSTNIDIQSYAGLPINEVVFWHDEGVVELPAWKVKMKKVGHDKEEGVMLAAGGLLERLLGYVKVDL